MAKVTMPQLGESVAEGTIGKWLKKPGDTIAKYEPLLEVITDKVNAEVPSPYAGTLVQILVEEGATVPNNAEIAVIQTEEEAATAGAAGPAPAAQPAVPAAAASQPAAAAAPAAPKAVEAAPVAAVADPGRQAAESHASTNGVAAPAHGPAGSDGQSGHQSSPVPGIAAAAAHTPVEAEPEGRMTPAVRRLLREHGLAASYVHGTGGGGRITREDVINYVESARTGTTVQGQTAVPGSVGVPVMAAQPSPAAPAPAPAAHVSAPASTPAASSTPVQARGIGGQRVTFPDGVDEVLVPLTQMRKGIAAQMTRALAVPHAYVQVEVDATRLVRAREAAKRDFQAREGISLSYVPFVIKAVVNALKSNPAFNAHWTEQGLLARRHINMGVAVAVPDGLIVPVVRDVDQLSIAGLNRAIADVAARARAGKLRLDDMGGGTFTVDNTGWFGSNITLPIINVPEVAILTMENITKRPVVVETDDGDVIAIRPVMNMVIGIDHRANDGAQAAAFVNDIKRWLEAIPADVSIY